MQEREWKLLKFRSIIDGARSAKTCKIYTSQFVNCIHVRKMKIVFAKAPDFCFSFWCKLFYFKTNLPNFEQIDELLCPKKKTFLNMEMWRSEYRAIQLQHVNDLSLTLLQGGITKTKTWSRSMVKQWPVLVLNCINDYVKKGKPFEYYDGEQKIDTDILSKQLAHYSEYIVDEVNYESYLEARDIFISESPMKFNYSWFHIFDWVVQGDSTKYDLLYYQVIDDNPIAQASYLASYQSDAYCKLDGFLTCPFYSAFMHDMRYIPAKNEPGLTLTPAEMIITTVLYDTEESIVVIEPTIYNMRWSNFLKKLKQNKSFEKVDYDRLFIDDDEEEFDD
tara:strand:+ start:1269 stop:2270 length:1002 start_codon:yes stop_codon:yes gene_type:complete